MTLPVDFMTVGAACCIFIELYSVLNFYQFTNLKELHDTGNPEEMMRVFRQIAFPGCLFAAFEFGYSIYLLFTSLWLFGLILMAITTISPKVMKAIGRKLYIYIIINSIPSICILLWIAARNIPR